MKMLIIAVLQLIQAIALITVAPLLLGWVNQNRAWLNNKKGAGIFQPYRNLHKLFLKETVLAENASPIFRAAPYIYFAAMCLITAIVPVLSIYLPFSKIADVVALVGLFALVRIFLALAAMDIGTAFGSMGARREMLVAFLCEPALLMIFFNVALASQSTSLATIAAATLSEPITLNPSLVFAAVAFVMILLAENARIPVDNPNTHLELTMIHEAMILEYSGRHLALIEWASNLKLLNYFAIGYALFFPWGIADYVSLVGSLIALLFFILKLAMLGSCLAGF